VKKIAIFASGTGTNAEIVIRHFELHKDAQVTLLISNRADAGAVKMAQEYGVETMIVDREQFFSSRSVLDELKVRAIDMIVLAGFLWLIPEILILAYRNRIVNIHPALLPKFGGKGMYGKHVHHAVLASGEKESGITIHFVNENFDEGDHIAQFTCTVEAGDTVETLAAKVQRLEHEHYASAIERLL
jgi:phosphoribosylglycinamide formyltransferase-1